MFDRLLVLGGVMAMALSAAPALAGRTAIDMNPDGSELLYHLRGYCDYNRQDCAPYGGVTLPYQVSIGGAAPTDRLWVHGNSILSFGDSIDFGDVTISNLIYDGTAPELTAYNRTLVSAGQDVGWDNGQYHSNAFFQSAKLSVGVNGYIRATWFYCQAPTSVTTCPASNVFSLLLRPTAKGYLGTFDFSRGSAGSDIGYVADGVYTETGNSFLLPATFTGNINFVPEPASWAMMIAGFGLVGGALRQRRQLAAAATR